jgi:transaldolase
MNSPLQSVFTAQGQSPWLDNLQRSYLTNGTLRQLIENGVRGLTSNPTIFQKAIQGSQDYDAQFTEEIKRGLSSEQAYWEMVLADITGALDQFNSLHELSGGVDGFVSVEVDPTLAHDGDATLTAARHLHNRINRSNVMIKIPATREGLPAIRTMIAEGRSVNVTLIFSLQRYSEVMEAYIAGLEDRMNAGESLSHVQSVASFFISRVDNEVDQMLDANASPTAMSLKGKTAIAQAKLAYELFTKAFSGDRWRALSNAGAHVQRPLWASTSTKNPAYPDTLYVDELIGPHTVNTLPDATLAAFADHGTVARTIDTDVHIAHEVWQDIQSLGIDMTAVANKLEREGVASFIKSFQELLDALSDKASTLS